MRLGHVTTLVLLVVGIVLVAGVERADQRADAKERSAHPGLPAGPDVDTKQTPTEEVAPEAEPKEEDPDAGGTHWRLETKYGPVHVWKPAGYQLATAGIVIYAHGYYTDVDDAWRDHRLAAQWRDSGRNALFIAPEVPSNVGRKLRWLDLGALIRAVREGTGEPRPWGPLVVVGHSGAYRSMVPWLEYPDVHHIINIDGFYGYHEDYLKWLAQPRGDMPNRLTVVAIDTLTWSEPMLRGADDALILDWIPDRFEDLGERARDVSILYLRSQFGHMELVTEGKTIPLLLQATRLPATEP